MLAEAGYRLHAVAALPALLDEWRRSGAISPVQCDEVKSFLDADQADHTDTRAPNAAP